MKKSYIKLLIAAVLLLTLFGAMSSIVEAAATDQYTVTIEYTSTACKVEVLVNDQKINPAETVGSVSTYLVNKNHATFEVRVTPEPGYSLSNLTIKETNLPIAPFDTNGTVYRPQLASDMAYVIKEEARQYTIVERAAAQGAHTFVLGAGTGTVQYYFASTDKVTLDKPTLEGYDFKGWQIKDDAGNTFPCNTIEGDIVFSTSNYPEGGDVFYATPIWVGKPQNVTRYDYEYDPNGSLIPVGGGTDASYYTTTWTEANGTEGVSGLLGGNDKDKELNAALDAAGYKKYVGYYEFAGYATDPKYYTVCDKIKPDAAANQVNRYYTPITYTVKVENIYDYDPTVYEGLKYVYNQELSMVDRKPERAGYDFAGWKVYIQKGGERTDVTKSIGNLGLAAIPNLTLFAREVCLAEGNDDSTITLEATWTPKTYAITYDWNGADEAKVTFTKANGYVFNADLVQVDPIRAGYTFKGWNLTSGETTEVIDSVEGKTTLPANTYLADITLQAIWEANPYTVTFDGNGATVAGTASMTVTFDRAPDLSAHTLPLREGHKFVGYTLTKDGEDFIIDETGAFLRSVWDIPEDTTLYAKWDVISYAVDVNVTNGRVWLNDVEYTGTSIMIPYGTTVNVKVLTTEGYKVTKWDGKAVTHTADYTTVFVMGAGDRTLNAAVLPVISAPSFTVDYAQESFLLQNPQDGSYRITCGAEALLIRVSGDDLFVNDQKVTRIAIPDSFFGKTAEIIIFGDGETTADSDPTALALAARPAAPALNDHIEGIIKDGNSITVNLNTAAGYTHVYEYALYYNNDGTGMVVGWMTPDGSLLVENSTGSVTFQNLYPGTQYYVYVRIKATETAPHGEEFSHGVQTPYKNYLDQVIADLNALKDGGEMVDALIENAKNEIAALEIYTSTFYTSLNGIYNNTVAALPFAKTQDARIAELRALRDDLIATDCFDDNGELTINTICEAAVAQIKKATAEDAVKTLANTASADMKQVKIKYLTFDDVMHLTANAGLPQGSVLLLSRLNEIASLIDAVDAAIKVGKISVAAGNSMTLAEAADMISSLEVMAGYDLRISNGTSVMTSFDGSFEMRLLLPEELRSATGLQVAYFNEKTGVLEILRTEREGNYLVFVANEVAEFVILGDPTMDLTGFIALLGVILICQLIAIAILLSRRIRSSKDVKHSVSLLPVLLAIRFLPDNALTAVMILGGLVILCQIVLMYLLLSSDVIWRRKQKKESIEEQPKSEAAPEEAIPVMAEPEVEDYAEESYEENETFGDNTDDMISYAAVDAIFDESVNDEADYTEEEDAAIETEADPSDDPYDFIEPAANPHYSLPDEDYEADQEATEESAEEAPVEDNVWDYDDEDCEDVYDEETLAEQAALEGDAEEAVDTAVEAAEWQYDEGEDAQPVEEEAPTEELLTVGDFGYFPDVDFEEYAGVCGADFTTDLAEEAPSEEATLSETEPSDEEDSEKDPSDEAEKSTEDASDEEDDEPEFYIPPDARGDDAPPPYDPEEY